MTMYRSIITLLLLQTLYIFDVIASDTFYNGQEVELFVNKVGPYYNPLETYHYYSLPVCTPEKIKHKSMTIGELLDGDRMAYSLYNIKFREAQPKTKLCSRQINKSDLKILKQAVEEYYYFEFVVDNFPFRGFLGHFEEGPLLPHAHKLYLWNYLQFIFQYDIETKSRIVSASVFVSSDTPFDLNSINTPEEVTFSYSVKWEESKVPYSKREELMHEFFPRAKQIHWMSVINSTVLVTILIIFISMALHRNLIQDLSNYEGSQAEDISHEDYGWKLIHGDVFRLPKHRMLLSSIVGCGSQFILLAITLLVLEYTGLLANHRHGALNTLAILLYALMSCLAGYISSSWYKCLGGEKWYWNIVLTFSLFSVPFFIIWSLINFWLWVFNTTQVLPFSTVIFFLLLWLVVGVPLTILGGIFGKNITRTLEAPCRTKLYPRDIPIQPWYNSRWAFLLFGGFLPFSAVSIEVYYIFLTIWGRQNFSLYGILLLVFIILLVVTACLSVALTYFQLSLEDYTWWWRSLYSTGAFSLFVFLYGIFFYYNNSQMNGFLQTIQYFGSLTIGCYILFLMIGAVGFRCSFWVVNLMYTRLKMD